MIEYLKSTSMLDYESSVIQLLIENKKWKTDDEFQKILEIYNYVRDEIKFGYNISDDIKASKVLEDGYGQCNTKSTLFMALLRAVGIPCRIHGFTIDKALQKGAVTGLIYKLTPKNIVHSWVEVFFEGKWFNIEGFIIDLPYLNKLQERFSDCSGNFCGFGVATNNFRSPQIDWNRNDTYIQKEGINQDFGIFNSPDEFFGKYSQEFSPVKKWVFENVARKRMNQNVSKIRGR